jgi:hypothetical protein
MSSPSPATIRASVHHERTRALVAKYGLSVEAHEWTPNPHSTRAPQSVMRVEKPIRMRIRHTCHICHTMFGAARDCRRCLHRRCVECPRNPPRKAHDDDKENKCASDSDGNDDDDDDLDRGKRRSYKVNSREGSPALHSSGKSRVASGGPQPIMHMQRAGRVCHQCQQKFPTSTASPCVSCGHLRCSKCPRELTSWAGPLGKDDEGNDVCEPTQRPDRVYRRPRQRIRWVCEQCSTVFKEGSQVCSRCLHKRCDLCIRKPYVLFPHLARETDTNSSAVRNASSSTQTRSWESRSQLQPVSPRIGQ